MTDPIAAIGLNQLHKIDDYNSLRRETANKWHLWCEENGYEPPLVLEESEPTYLRYPVLVEQEKKSKPGWASSRVRTEIRRLVHQQSTPHSLASRAMSKRQHSRKAMRQPANTFVLTSSLV